MAAPRERRTSAPLSADSSTGSGKPKHPYLGGDSDLEEDVDDYIQSLRLVNTVNTDDKNKSDGATKERAPSPERERELPPTVNLPSLKWTNKLVNTHLRRTRLWANLTERLRADADARAAAGDPLDDLHLQVREAKYKELFGAVYSTSVHLFRRLSARTTAAKNLSLSVWDHGKICILEIGVEWV